MFRKLFSWATAAIIAVLVIAGCSKKPVDYVPETDYAPQGMVAFPDTNKVVIKWNINTEAEAQSGFEGYYVYCTSRHLTSYGTENDSIMGLALLPAESLQYYEIPNCPFPKGIDTVSIFVDPGTKEKLTFGTKYYFYVRSKVDGQLSWASNWVWSCPRPVGYGTVYAFDTTDHTNGKSSCFGFKTSNNTIVPQIYTIPTFKWRVQYLDYTWQYPATTVYQNRYSKHFISADSSHLRVTDSLLADTSFVGFAEWDSLPKKFSTVWRSNSDSSLGKMDTLINSWYKSTTLNSPLYNNIDLVLERVTGDPTKVRLTCPLTVSNIPVGSAWSKGRETFIQDYPAGYEGAIPDAFSDSSYSITLNVGTADFGKVYQIKTAGLNYAKIKIDSVVASGTTVKVCFHYAYQMAAGIKNF